MHLHDNDQSDDLHLMPFDGTLNWKEVMQNLKNCNYVGPITMELCYRYEYLDMGIEKFYLLRIMILFAVLLPLDIKLVIYRNHYYNIE